MHEKIIFLRRHRPVPAFLPFWGCAGIQQEGAVKPQEPSRNRQWFATPAAPPVPDESEMIRSQAKEMLLGKMEAPGPWETTHDRVSLIDDNGYTLQCRGSGVAHYPGQLPHSRQGPDRDHDEERQHPDVGLCRHEGGS